MEEDLRLSGGGDVYPNYSLNKKRTRMKTSGGEREEEGRQRLRYMANVFIHRRVLLPLILPCGVCLLTLPLLLLVYWIIHTLSGGYGFLSILVAAILTYYQGHHLQRRQHPPSAQDAPEPNESKTTPIEDTISYNHDLLQRQQKTPVTALVRGRLVFVRAWLLSLVVCRWILGPLLHLPFSSNARSSSGNTSSDTNTSTNVLFIMYTQICLRWALGVSVLSIAVSFCYLGQFPIVQCSSRPLPTNPMDVMIQYFVTKCQSLPIFINWLSSPNDNQPNNNNNNNDHRQKSPLLSFNKYLRPTIFQCLYQMIIHALAALIFSSFTIAPIFSSNNSNLTDSSSIKFLSITSVLTAFTTVYTTYFAVDGTLSHEIIYRQFEDYNRNNNDISSSLLNDKHQTSQKQQSQPEKNLFSFVNSIGQSIYCQIHQKNMLYICFILPILSFGFFQFIPQQQSSFFSISLTTWAVSYATTLFLTIYFVSMDILIRKLLTTKSLSSLSNPGFNVDKFVNDIIASTTINSSSRQTSTTTFLPEDLIVEATLAGFGSNVIRHVVSSRMIAINDKHSNNDHFRHNILRQTKVLPSITDLQIEEMERNKMTMNMVADAMLLNNTDTQKKTSLEEDLLRIAILESIGGGGGNIFTIHTVKEKTGNEPPTTEGNNHNDLNNYYSMLNHHTSYRHLQAVKRRLQASDAAAMGQILFQPIIVPVVRSFCAYAGGLGEALIRCSKDSYVAALKMHPNSWEETLTWSLPPAASASAEYSILGAARLLTLSCTQSTTTDNNRYNRLNLLVPVVLDAAFRLRCGVLSYAHYLMIDSEKRDGNLDHLDIKHLEQLVWDHDNISRQQTDHVIHFIAVKCHDLRYILKACDDAATMIHHDIIMYSWKEKYAYHNNDLEGPYVSMGCQKWLRSLQKNTSPQVFAK